MSRHPARCVRFTGAALLALAIGTTTSGLRADESAAVVVSSAARAELRVQLAEGVTMPCDSGNNRMLFDGRLVPGASIRASIAGDCICIRSTSAEFPSSDWTQSGLKCRPRICRGRVCRPAPDPTIYLTLP